MKLKYSIEQEILSELALQELHSEERKAELKKINRIRFPVFLATAFDWEVSQKGRDYWLKFMTNPHLAFTNGCIRL